MSYILDALRRADSERERGSVPGLYAQSFPLDAADLQTSRRAVPWPAIAIGLAVALIGALAWHGFSGDSPADAGPPTAVAPAAPAVPAPVATTGLLPPPVTTPQATAAPEPAPPPRAVATAPAPRAAPPPPPQAEPPARVAEAPVPPRIYLRDELPPEIRRALPPLSIDGSIDSKKAANRVLIVNGQLFHEGDKLAPDLWLEQIKLRAAVLKFKDYRYTVTF